MSQEIPTLIPNWSVSPWSRQPPNPAQDQLPKNIHDQLQLVKSIQQMLVTEQQKLEWMMNNFKAGTQGFQPGQHRMKHILSNPGPSLYLGQMNAVQNEDPNHVNIEDLVVEEINKRRSNDPQF